MPSKTADKKTFVVVKNLPAKKADLKRTGSEYKNKQPRCAALKAATAGIKNIYLLEAGTKKVHVFKGSVKRVKTKKDAWAGLSRPYHNESSVKKVKVHHLE